MQNKTTSQPTEHLMLVVGASTTEVDVGQNIDDVKPMEEEDPKETSLKKKPLELQRMQSLHRESAFDDKCLKFRGADNLTLEGVAEGSSNMDLLNPSSMPLTSSLQTPKKFTGILK